jgi:hypothetical protein
MKMTYKNKSTKYCTIRAFSPELTVTGSQHVLVSFHFSSSTAVVVMGGAVGIHTVMTFEALNSTQVQYHVRACLIAGT